MRSAALAVAPRSVPMQHALAAYAAVAGLLMVALGVWRLRVPTPRDSPHSARSITATYSLMIVLGLVLVLLAIFWRRLL